MKRFYSAIALATCFVAAQGCGNGSAPSASESIGTQRARIVGGIADTNHRYVVSLNGCSGTVISKHTVLTAGHCFSSVSTVGFGPKVSGATTIKIASKVQDPLYQTICDQDATYDLTVVKLMDPAPTQAAPLLRATLDNTPKYIGPSWVWVGYGLTMQGGSSGTKRVTTFPVDLIGPASGRGSLCDIPDTLIYATSHGRNACNGDSGGPSFFVHGGVEYLAGVVSSGDDACTLDDTQQRSDQPHIDRFIQQQIDLNEGMDPCRSNGVCDETCNTNGQVGDPDCAANHCGADGICSEACVAPRDPDCASVDSDNCGDNGVCDLTCASDPDCTRDCAAEGNCIPNCATPDPDCAGQDGGTVDAGGGGSTDAGTRDAVVNDVTTPPGSDGGNTDAPTSTDATPPTSDAGARDAAVTDAGNRDATTSRDATNVDTGLSDVATSDAPVADSAGTTDSGSTGSGGSGAGGTGGGGAMTTPEQSGCSCRTASPRGPNAGGVAWLALAVTAGALRRRKRRS